MKDQDRNVVAKASLLLALIVVPFVSGCVVAEPREGYYDRDHARYYHNHGWVACDRDGDNCRQRGDRD